MNEAGFQPPPLPRDTPSAAVLGLDNVQLDLSFAGIGSRGLAAAVDYFLLSVFQLIWLLGGAALLGLLFGASSGWAFAILTLGSFLIQWGFFAGFEIFTEGQTPGKQLLGLRVVSEQGGQASPTAIIVRNLLRTFDVLIGLPVMMFERRARRLGDLVAGTAVIHEFDDGENRIELDHFPQGWGAEEIALAETFLRRAPQLEPARAQALATKLLSTIAVQEPGFLPADPGLETSFDRVEFLHRALVAS